MARREQQQAELQKFTLPHFLEFAARLVLDTGECWEVEPFQQVMFQPILAGVKETWTIIPEANGKTSSMAGFGLYHCMFIQSPWVPIVASSRDQAEIMAQQAYGIIRSTPGLEYNRRTHTGYFRIFEGYRQIKNMRTGGRGIKVYAADVGTSDGGIPTLVLCDEGHRWPDLGPYRLWKGKCGKRKGQIGMTSTSGEPGSEFEEQRDKIRESAEERELHGAFGRYRSPNICLTEWMVRSVELVADMSAVKEANPFSYITEETLREEYNSPTTDLGDWKRLKCNLPSRTIHAAITELEWSRAYTALRIPEGVHVDCGCDVAWKHDTFAIQPLWLCDLAGDDVRELLEALSLAVEDLIRFGIADQSGTARNARQRLLDLEEILTPPRDGSTLHPDFVKEAFTRINDRNPIDTVVIDLERAEDTASWLEDELGITLIDRGQGNALACEDYEAFMKGLRNGTLRHTGRPGLRKHAMNAIARRLPSEKRRFDRPSQSRAKRRQEVRVIDCLTAAGLVNWNADQLVEEESPLLVAWR